MTPLSTPKPLTEKEPMTNDEFENAERDLDRAVNPDDCVVWTAAYGEMLIAEIRRLRAGPIREKILRDAIDIAINEIQSFDIDENDEGIIFNCTQRLLDALKQADAVKDEDKIPT